MTDLYPLAIILTPIALLGLAYVVREYRRAMDQFELAGRGVPFRYNQEARHD